jgi:hypothetical protein
MTIGTRKAGEPHHEQGISGGLYRVDMEKINQDGNGEYGASSTDESKGQTDPECGRIT